MSAAGEEPEVDPSCKALWLLAFRRQHLQHRRLLVLKAREVSCRGGVSSEPPEENINASELESIEAELEEMSRREERLLKSGSLQKDPYDVRLFGELIVPEPDYDLLKFPEPDYDMLTFPEPDYDLLKFPEPDYDMPEEPSSQPEPPENTPRPVVPEDKLRRDPDWVTCSSCLRVVHTVVKHTVSENSWLLCCMLSVFGCVCGCCLIPFFLHYFKDVSHYCPNCNAKIRRISRI